MRVSRKLRRAVERRTRRARRTHAAPPALALDCQSLLHLAGGVDEGATEIPACLALVRRTAAPPTLLPSQIAM